MKTKAFIRRVGFGLKPDEKVPTNPLDWAKEQMLVVPKLIWPGRIYSEKEMLDIELLGNNILSYYYSQWRDRDDMWMSRN